MNTPAVPSQIQLSEDLSAQRKLDLLNSHRTLVVRVSTADRNFNQNDLADALQSMVLSRYYPKLPPNPDFSRIAEMMREENGFRIPFTVTVEADKTRDFEFSLDQLPKLVAKEIKRAIASDEGSKSLKENGILALAVGEPIPQKTSKTASHLDTYKWWYISGCAVLTLGISAMVIARKKY